MTPTPLRLCAAFAVVTAAALPITAHANPGPPAGADCGFNTINGSSIPEDYTYTGFLYGAVAAPGSAVSLTCSIHVGNTTHSGTAAVRETAGPTPGVAVLEPRVISFWADPFDDVALCTQASVDGTTWYQLPDGGWTTDPDSPCYVSTTITIPPEELLQLTDPIWDLLICLESDLCNPVNFDETACVVFKAAAPGVPGIVDINAQGDVFLAGEPFWDCPPYDLFG